MKIDSKYVILSTSEQTTIIFVFMLQKNPHNDYTLHRPHHMAGNFLRYVDDQMLGFFLYKINIMINSRFIDLSWIEIF